MTELDDGLENVIGRLPLDSDEEVNTPVCMTQLCARNGISRLVALSAPLDILVYRARYLLL